MKSAARAARPPEHKGLLRQARADAHRLRTALGAADLSRLDGPDLNRVVSRARDLLAVLDAGGAVPAVSALPVHSNSGGGSSGGGSAAVPELISAGAVIALEPVDAQEGVRVVVRCVWCGGGVEHEVLVPAPGLRGAAGMQTGWCPGRGAFRLPPLAALVDASATTRSK